MIQKKTFLLALKIIISILLLAFIASKIDWAQALANLYRANYFLIFFVFLLILFERIQLTYKWNLLIRVRGISVGFWRLFIINSIGAFWGLFLPSSIGSDIAKSYYLIKNNSEKSVSISSVLVDRILGILALLLLCVISILVGGSLVSRFNIGFYVSLLLLIFLFFLYLFQKEKTSNFLQRILPKIKFKLFVEKIIKLHLSVLEYKKHPKTLLSAFFLTFIVNITRVLIFYVISLAFNIPIPIIYFFIFIPILTVVIMIPISIGGLGVGEGAFITFFSLVGISINDSIVVVLTNTLANTMFTLIGGLVIFFYNAPAKKEIVLENKNKV
jgi:uncharacterized protein (TIRG00374 family)